MSKMAIGLPLAMLVIACFISVAISGSGFGIDENGYLIGANDFVDDGGLGVFDENGALTEGWLSEFRTYPSGTWFVTAEHRAVQFPNGSDVSEQGMIMHTTDGMSAHIVYKWVNDSGSFDATRDVSQLEGVNVPSASLAFNAFSGAIAIVVSSTVIILVFGFKLFSSGWSDVTVKAVYILAFCYGMWLVFSVGAIPVLTAIPYAGWALYFIMTLIYSIGVVGEV